jgi:glycerol-3-phosphate dehydrogenase
MKRDLVRLSEDVYDLLVIGGGIYGVCVAWDAILRGLSVALVDKGDFGNATSYNTLGIIHGGLRYIQSGNIRRARLSLYEQMAFMRIAPHLIHPLPFLIPTYGHFLRGKELLFLVIQVYNLIGFDRNRFMDTLQLLPSGYTLSREECIKEIHGIDSNGLTGGVIFYDCQIYSPARLILAIAKSASMAGANLANYVRVEELLKEGNRVVGAKVKDVIGGEYFRIHAKIVVNTSGPWLNCVMSSLSPKEPFFSHGLSKAFNLLTRNQLTNKYALGIYSNRPCVETKDLLKRGSRYLFFTPWQNRCLIGTAHLSYDSVPDSLGINKRDIQTFIDEINLAHPAASLKLEDVVYAFGGLLPTVGSNSGDVRLSTEYKICDHMIEHGVDGLISVVGVKFTEARYVAEKVVDLVFKKLGRASPESTTAVTPVYGGNIERFSDFLSEEIKKRKKIMNSDIVRNLIYHYGSAYTEILRYIKGNTDSNDPIIEQSAVAGAEIIHGIREEMAQRLSDIVFRRTNVYLDGKEFREKLTSYAEIMSNELKWSRERTVAELAGVESTLTQFAYNV